MRTELAKVLLASRVQPMLDGCKMMIWDVQWHMQQHHKTRKAGEPEAPSLPRVMDRWECRRNVGGSLRVCGVTWTCS